MAKNVYLFPECVGTAVTYTPQFRTYAEADFWGAPVNVTEITPRVGITIEGEIVPRNHAAWETFLDRVASRISLFAITNQTLRQRQGWDVFPAVNSSGTEYWRESGRTTTFPGGTPTSPWRTVACAANGAASADATSIAVDGLLPNEVIPAGSPIRISGVYRHIVRTAASANGAGAATLQLAHPLRSSVADGATIAIPGDLGVYQLESYQPGPGDADGYETFQMAAREVYASEYTGGFTWVVD